MKWPDSRINYINHLVSAQCYPNFVENQMAGKVSLQTGEQQFGINTVDSTVYIINRKSAASDVN